MEEMTYGTIFLIWLDVIFTAIFIHYFGIEIEANQIGRYLFEHPETLIVVKIACSVLIYLLYTFSDNLQIAKIGLIAIFIVYCLLTLYHIIISVIIWTIMKDVKI